MASGTILFAEMKQEAWNVQTLRSLGVDEEWLAEAHPTQEQIKDLVKGLLYLKEMYVQFWVHDRSNADIYHA